MPTSPHIALNDVVQDEEEDEWQIILSDRWWHTPIDIAPWSFRYTDGRKPTKKRIANPPLTCQQLLIRRVRPSWLPSRHAESQLCENKDNRCTLGEDEEVSLNGDLVGVRVVDEVLFPYESNVGFHCGHPLDAIRIYGYEEKAEVSLCREMTVEQLTSTKDRWKVLVEDLAGNALRRSRDPFLNTSDRDHGQRDSSPGSGSEGLHRSITSISSNELTDSDNTTSMPSTPKPHPLYAHVVVKNPSPSSSISSNDQDSLIRPLNVSASSFVPFSPTPKSVDKFPALRTSLPSPHLANPQLGEFTFPTLDVPPMPAVKIQKDDQGFYNEVQGSAQRLSSSLLPPFLQESTHRRRAPASKTRAIVDRLRLSHHQQMDETTTFTHSLNTSAMQSPSTSPVFHDPNFFKPRLSVSEGAESRSPSPTSQKEDEGGDDGWMGVDESISSESQSKTRRTRELFQALSRNRSDSLVFERREEGSGDSPGLSKEGVNSKEDGSVPLVSQPLLTASSDGWIEGSHILVAGAPVADKQEKVETQDRSQRQASRSRWSKKSNGGNSAKTLTGSGAGTISQPSFASRPSASHPPNTKMPTTANTQPRMPPFALPTISPLGPHFSPTSPQGATPFMFPAPQPQQSHHPAYAPIGAVPMPYATYMQMQMQMQYLQQHMHHQQHLQNGSRTTAAAPAHGLPLPPSMVAAHTGPEWLGPHQHQAHQQRQQITIHSPPVFQHQFTQQQQHLAVMPPSLSGGGAPVTLGSGVGILPAVGLRNTSIW